MNLKSYFWKTSKISSFDNHRKSRVEKAKTQYSIISNSDIKKLLTIYFKSKRIRNVQELLLIFFKKRYD